MLVYVSTVDRAMDVKKLHGGRGEMWTGVEQCAEYSKSACLALEIIIYTTAESSIS
jgi:hypothetical protein